MHLCVMIGDELLNDLVTGILELIKSLRHHFLDFLQIVHSNVLVAVGLKYVSSDLTPLEALGMDKMAKFTACASVWPMVVTAGDGAEVAWLDYLIHIYDGLLRRNLVNLSHLCYLSLLFLIDLFVLCDGLIGELDQYIRWLTRRLHEQATNALLLFYKTRKNG